MKVAIFAGGLGTRIKEETGLRPKPMIEIGEKPILWHIMKMYSSQGFNDFILLLGYKSEKIKEYFLNWANYNNSFEINLKHNKVNIIEKQGEEDWNVTLLETGLNTQTAGRLKRIAKYVNNETFMATYGDGVSDLDIKQLVNFHKQHKKVGTLTAVIPPARFGALELEKDTVKKFTEKPKEGEMLVNGGFYTFEPEIFDYISGTGDAMPLEKEPLSNLAKDGQLCAFKHTGFWQCMDTRRDLELLETMWATGKASWKKW